MAPYQYQQIDPRPAGKDVNEEIFSSSSPILGLEVTLPQYAARCDLGNLDHHGPEDTELSPSACEQAIDFPLPPEGAKLITVRCDADSVTAMAVFAARFDGLSIDLDLVRKVGEMDRLGPRSGKRDDRVVAIARKAADFKVSLADRVAWVVSVLEGTHDPDEVRDLVAAREKEFDAARAASQVRLEADGRIAVVVSSHRFATPLGYELAPVVVAQNPVMPVDFRDPSKGTHVKYTVCRYDSHVKCDVAGALAELGKLEPGWGGRGDIGGSPQGISSRLSLDEVVEVIKKHLG